MGVSPPSSNVRVSSTFAYDMLSENQVHFISGAAAGLTSAVLVCPLDVVKVRMQSSKHTSTGTFALLQYIYRNQGYPALYSGLTPTILSYLSDRAIWFSSYDGLKTWFAAELDSTRDKAHIQILSVIFASLISDVFTTPLWVIRTRMMIQSPKTPYYYHSIKDACKSMYKNEGIFSFYKGFLPSLIGVVHPVIQFPLYERLKLLFTDTKDTCNINHFGIIASSAISKMIAGLITYPHEVIRTRLQIQTTMYIPAPLMKPSGKSNEFTVKYKGLFGTARTIIKEEGLSGLYRGLGTNMIRTVPSTAASLWIYEWLKKDLTIYFSE